MTQQDSIRVVYSRTRGLAPTLIRMASWWGPWSHCALVDGDSVIECLALKGGVVRTPLAEARLRASAWSEVHLACPYPAMALEWARSTVGQPYDWGGVISIPFRAREWESTNRWYCSEHVEAALIRGGLSRWRTGMQGISPCQSYWNSGT